MCIEPPRPRLVPSLLAHQLGEHPERVEALGQAVTVAAVGRGDDVGRAQRPARADRGAPPARSRGGRSRGSRRRGRGRRPAPRTRGSAASADASRAGRGSRTAGGAGRPRVTKDVLYWSVQDRERAMTEQIEIPESFPGPGDGRRQAGRDHRRRPRASARCSPTPSPQAGASVALVARTETDLKAVAEALPGPCAGAQRRRDRRGLQRGGRRRHGGRVGRRRRLDLQRRDLARSWPARARPTPSVWRQVLEVNLTGAFLGARAAARVMGDGGRLIFTGSVLGERPRAGPRRLQRVEGRAGRPGQGPGPRPGPGRHHRERRRARAGSTRRWPTGGRTDPSWPPTITGHTAQRRWGAPDRPGRRLPVPGLRRRRPSSPAPCSASTAGTCSYERRTRTTTGRSRSPARAARSARRSPGASPARPATDLVLSDVSATVARRDGRRPAGRPAARSRPCSPT